MTARFWVPTNVARRWTWTIHPKEEFPLWMFPTERSGKCRPVNIDLELHGLLRLQFESNDGRKVTVGRSLVQTARLAHAAKATKRPNRFVVFAMGDSTMEHAFDGMACSLARSRDVTLNASRTVAVSFHGHHFHPRRHQHPAFFKVVEGTTQTDELTVRLLLVRHDKIPGERETILDMCDEADVLLVNWGLHYEANRMKDFTRMLQSGALGWLRECASARNTTVVYVSALRQHFPPPSTNGRWPGHGVVYPPNATCAHVALPVEQTDVQSLVLRRLVSESGWELAPIPLMDDFVTQGSAEECSLQATSGVRGAATKKQRLHYLPWADLSANLEDFHKARVSHVFDCTHHIAGYSTLYDGHLEGVHLAVARELCVNATESVSDVGPHPQCALGAVVGWAANEVELRARCLATEQRVGKNVHVLSALNTGIELPEYVRGFPDGHEFHGALVQRIVRENPTNATVVL